MLAGTCKPSISRSGGVAGGSGYLTSPSSSMAWIPPARRLSSLSACFIRVYASPPPAPPPGPWLPFNNAASVRILTTGYPSVCGLIGTSEPFMSVSMSIPGVRAAVPPSSDEERRLAAVALAPLPRSERAVASSPSPAVSAGMADPTTLHTSGSALNCETITCSFKLEVESLVGLKLMVTSTSPFAGMTPEAGSTANSGFCSSGRMANSNSMGTLQRSVTTLLDVSISGHWPRSTRFGKNTSFATGYAWIGTSRFSSPL
mmetsp:Transcript_30994/g.101030  ORF Transcript_30994/g.101030 Transcript_30994/m.101030 type:complete len:259 (+) Transcript_30994:1411-2187(+)